MTKRNLPAHEFHRGKLFRNPEGGFSLIEVLVVVVMLGILATIGMTAYGRWIGRARTAEANAMLAEISAKETIYLTEFGTYLPLRSEAAPWAFPSPDELPIKFYPSNPSAATFSSRSTAVVIANAALWPASWSLIGLRPRRQECYCTYMANAGLPGQAAPVGGIGAGLLAGQTATNWFYAIAACNLTGPAVFPGQVTLKVITHASSTISNLNDGR